jgi:hypothetical protein
MIVNSPRLTRRISVLTLLACLAISLVCVAYPLYVIRPFRAQGAHELAVALIVARVRVGVTFISALIAVTALVLYWREQAQWRRRILPAMGALLACVLAFLARVNIYELMFHPIDVASFSSASRVKLDADEKVIAVRIGGEARAYPVRIMSYHHLINDVVDQLAIVATY